MSYVIKFRKKEIKIDKYLMKTSSMVGETIDAVLDNEQELAYYAFFKGYYNMHYLSSMCTYHDLYNADGKILNDKDLDNIIKKYFPNETKKIHKRLELCGNKFVKNIMNLTNWRPIKYWITYQQEIINNMPDDIKKMFNNIELKSNQYVESFFNEQGMQY